MPRIPFEDLPDHGRLWVFPAARALAPDEADRIGREVDEFLDGWAAHGAPLRSGRTLVEDRFVVVGVDEDATAPSGCSIDALTKRLRELGGRLDVEMVRHAPVWYRSDDGIRAVSRADFKRLRDAGEVDEATRVFDTSLTRIDRFRGGDLERPARESWHGPAFFGTLPRG